MPGREAIAGLVGMALAAALAAPAAAANCAHSADVAGALSPAARRATVLCAVSAARTARGLPPVRESTQLTLAAQGHADDMVARRFFSHVAPGGTTLSERVRVTGYMNRREDWELGEAIASAQEPLDTADELVSAWLASPEHRAILLDRTFKDVGIGLTPGLTDGTATGGATAVLDFGSRSASPTLPRWRSRSRIACARTARISRQKPARCASISKRSTR